MKCIACGKELPDEAKFCLYCGQKYKQEPAEEETSVTEEQALPVEEEEAPAQEWFPVSYRLWRWVQSVSGKLHLTPKGFIAICSSVLLVFAAITISAVAASRPKLTGQWAHSGDYGYICWNLNKDGSFYVEEDDSYITGTYKVSGNTLTFYTDEGERHAYEFELKKDLLYLTDDDGDLMVVYRKD